MLIAIDDQPEILFVIKRYLKDKFEVETFQNELEALEFVEKNHEKIDLIIVDFNMPRMNGLDFIKQIRSGKYQKKFLIVSAEREANLENAKGDDMNIHYLIKPVLKSNLIEKVTELVPPKSFF